MEDLRLWSRKMIYELLKKYKSLPALWKRKSPEYKNKTAKAKAYRELVTFCKKNGCPDANRDFVVKKIQSLRGSLRKEEKKAKEYELKGKKFHSKLWYYKHIAFAKGQDSDGEEDVQSEESYEDKSYEQPNDDDGLYGDDGDDGYDLQSVPMQNVLAVLSTETDIKEKKNERPKKKPSKQESLRIVEPIPKDLSEAELTGMAIAKKLARMDQVQAVYAESIINNVVRRGLLQNLLETTNICDNMCQNQSLFLDCD